LFRIVGQRYQSHSMRTTEESFATPFGDRLERDGAVGSSPRAATLSALFCRGGDVFLAAPLGPGGPTSLELVAGADGPGGKPNGQTCAGVVRRVWRRFGLVSRLLHAASGAGRKQSLHRFVVGQYLTI